VPTHPAAPAHAPPSPPRTGPLPADRARRWELPAAASARISLTVEPSATVTLTGWDDERVVVHVGPEGDGPPVGVEIVCPGGDGSTVRVCVYDVRPEAGVGRALRIDVRVPRRFAAAVAAPRSTALVTRLDGPVRRR
jgi:hypothetical protein